MTDDEKTPEELAESRDEDRRDEQSSEDEIKEFSAEEIENDPAYSPEDEKFKGIKGG